MVSPRDGQGSYAQVESNDAIVSRLVQQDNVPWYNKPNLRLLYFFMFQACVGVEITSGQVSQVHIYYRIANGDEVLTRPW